MRSPSQSLKRHGVRRPCSSFARPLVPQDHGFRFGNDAENHDYPATETTHRCGVSRAIEPTDFKLHFLAATEWTWLHSHALTLASLNLHGVRRPCSRDATA